MENEQLILDELANLNPPKTEFNNKAVGAALNLLSNPQSTYKVIHITGTNGKGSTAAFIEAGLRAAGYKVGKYTSPYIHSLNECIVLDQVLISNSELIATYLNLKEKLIIAKIALSSFEMLTVIMFVYFARANCQYLVLEVGLGGLNDATNVVKSEYSIITNVSLEHKEWLGNSLESIAWHKVGIINDGMTIIADNTPELIAAVKIKTTNYVNVLDKYTYQTRLDWQNFTTNLKVMAIDPLKSFECELGLFGHFQARNFLAAYEVLQNIQISDELIFKAARNTTWPGRLQLIQSRPRIIADAAHNANGCLNLYQSLYRFVNPDDCVLIVSILADKDQPQMLNYYAKLSSFLIVCNLANQPRAIPAIKLAKLARGRFKQVHIYNSPVLALKKAKQLGKNMIIISGSTYLLKHFVTLLSYKKD